tara:strand:+ start:141 stop:821 length:681 start_codon:yes stop_codon:yes gene_type:complete
MKIAVMQSNYMPWVGYFDLIRQVDQFIIYDTVQYTKNDWRNRNQILSNGQLKWLTIPVRVKSLTQKINETQISQTNWNIKHWKNINANYAKAKGFNFFKKEFEEIYNVKSKYLSDINFSLIKKVCEVLNINTKILRAEDFSLSGNKNDRLIQLCKSLNANIYLSSPSAKSYINEKLFKENSISLDWMKYEYKFSYPQFSDEFYCNVSIIDMICHLGEESSTLFNQL